jgi:hypothetical protein
MAPLIKDAIQKAVNWEQVNAMNWHNTYKCYGCHVQTQTLIGMELSRDKVSVDDARGRQFLDFLKSCQMIDGSMGWYPNPGATQYPIQTTTLFAWALVYYHESTQIDNSLIKALDYLITRQNASGYWVSDLCNGALDWWFDIPCNSPSTPFTAYNTIALAKAYQLTGLQKYKDSMLKAVDFFKGADHTISIITAAHIIIGLQTAFPFVDDPDLKTAMETKITTVIEYIRSNQNSDGGWSRYVGNTSDPLPTAHVLYAMSLAGIPGTDPALRNGTTYLLNKQNPDGTWTTIFIRKDVYPDKYFGATTWAMISLPVALETIEGVAADLTVILPSNIQMNKSSITPAKITISGSDTTYLWSFTGMNEDAEELIMDLTVKNLELGEVRKVAQEAYLSFKDSYTGDSINIPIDIPSVTGIAPVSIEVETDKEIYTGNEDVTITITTTIKNISPETRSPTATITIEDLNGNAVANIAEFTVDTLSPSHEVPFLEGWDNRIPLRIDHTKIDADLTDFPLRIHLGMASGINSTDVSDIFAVLGDNRKRITVTTPDGKTQCYVEVERWDAAASEAELWVKVPFISSLEDTILYLYYDPNQYDNIYYVGDTGEIPSKNLWDSHYKAVYHMSQDPAWQILDSTYNFNHGTANGSMISSDLTDGKVGKAVKFDGIDDYISTTNRIINPNPFMIELLFKTNTTDGGNFACFANSQTGGSALHHRKLWMRDDGKIAFGVLNISANIVYIQSPNSYNDGSFHHIVSSISPSGMKLYVDGILTASNANTSTYPYDGYWRINDGPHTYEWNIGINDPYVETVIDEVRISDIERPQEWVKASYYGQIDQLINFGNTESTDNVDPSATMTYTFTWDTGTTPSGNYLVKAGLYENGILLSEDTADLTILPDKTLTSKVTTDKISYFSNEPVTITSTIQSTSTNYIFENLTATVAILSQQSADSLYTDIQTIPILLPGQQTELKTYWNTGINPPGAYPVTLEIKDETGTVLSTSTTTITISEEIKPSKLLKGQISVDKQSLFQGDPVAITYSVTNAGNIDLPQIDLSILTVHVVELTAHDTLTDQTSLQKGQIYANTQNLNTNDYTAKDYLVILRARISGVEETLAGTYFRVEGAPSAPSLNSPGHEEDVETCTPLLSVNNASDPNDDDLTYEFELYSDINLTEPPIASSGMIPEGENITSWLPSTGSGQPLELQENEVYYWRARAYDGLLYGGWMLPASFRVNLIDEPPTAPTLSSPEDHSEVDILTPTLTVNNAYDPDSTDLTYNFEVALDQDFKEESIVTSVTGIFEGQGTTSWQVPINLTDNTYYYWHAQADDWHNEGPWMSTARFFVNTANDAPSKPVIISPVNDTEISVLLVDIIIENSEDLDYDTLTYIFEIDTVNTFDSPNLITSGSIPEGQVTTSWFVDGLNDNTYYYVRAKASDGLAESQWSDVIGFFANTANDAPTPPVLANPSDQSGVNTFTPTLSVHNSTDIDRDVLTYEFRVYDDAEMTSPVSSASGVQETPDITSWTVSVTLTENETYYWMARASDGELYSGWMPLASFMVNTANDAPGAPTLHSPADGSSIDTLYPTLSVENAEDPDSDTLTYDFEVYADGILIDDSLTKISEDISGITSATLVQALSDNTTYTWRARAYDGDRYGEWMDTATFSIHLPVLNITATIDFDPNTLNQGSNGKWVTVYIELPDGYDVNDIIVSSVLLEGNIPAEPWPYCIADYDKDGIPDLKVKFNRNSVINILPEGDNVLVHVTGTVGTVTFEGVDTIRVIH